MKKERKRKKGEKSKKERERNLNHEKERKRNKIIERKKVKLKLHRRFLSILLHPLTCKKPFNLSKLDVCISYSIYSLNTLSIKVKSTYVFNYNVSIQYKYV